MSDDASWVTVMAKDKMESGQVLGGRIGDKQIAIYNLDGIYYATDNICTHSYAFLSEGAFEDGVIECPIHGGAFDVKTGKAVCSPASVELRTYPVRILGNDVQIFVD